MPEARLARARRSLPAGYRFGDALYQYPVSTQAGDSITVPLPLRWRPLHENAAALLQRRQRPDGCPACQTVGECLNFGRTCQVAAREAWNVIEGEEHGVDEAHHGAERTVSTPARGLDR